MSENGVEMEHPECVAPDLMRLIYPWIHFVNRFDIENSDVVMTSEFYFTSLIFLVLLQ